MCIQTLTTNLGFDHNIKTYTFEIKLHSFSTCFCYIFEFEYLKKFMLVYSQLKYTSNLLHYLTFNLYEN
jgi:hypothetical protein